MKSPALRIFGNLSLAAFVACGSPTPAPVDEAPDMSPPSATTMVTVPTPCPDDLRADAHARGYMVSSKPLSEHPNPTCDRYWVCVPVENLVVSLPLCRWERIATGQEDLQVWIALSSRTPTPNEVNSRITVGTTSFPSSLHTNTWRHYRRSSSTSFDNIVIEAEQPGSETAGVFDRIRLDPSRKFVIDVCPRLFENKDSFTANCGIWNP